MISKARRFRRRVAKKLRSALREEAPKATRSVKTYERDSAENLYEAVDFIRSTKVAEMNRLVEDRIRSEVRNGRRLRVAFLVSDRSKWNADSLLEEMRRVGWSTRLYLCLKKVNYAGRDDRIQTYEAERRYFANIDPGLVELYDPVEDLEVPVEDKVEADIIFYQQPWGMKDFPRRMLGRALGAYMHYGFMLMANHGMHYNIGGFHPYLWRYFTQTEAHRILHLKHDPSAYDKLVVTGYPKLDVYLSELPDGLPAIWPVPDPSVRRIIYAPHHSLQKNSLRMATFPWNHKFILDLARNTPQLQWVYKPHPNLKYNVSRSKLMTRDEYLQYEEAWSKLSNATVYDHGQYFDIFRTSDALITDCGSFLAEYLPTGKPIIWLASADSVGFNPVGASLAEAFYQVRSLPELQSVFDKVVIGRGDYLESVRLRAAQRLFPQNGKAATAVVEHLRAALEKNS